MKKLLVILVLVAGIAALVVGLGGVDRYAEWRVKSALVEAGVNEGVADCMSVRMVERLSFAQLRNLQAGMEPIEGEPQNLDGLGDLIAQVRDRLDRIGDPEVIKVTASSAGICTIGIG
ncbi:hypothetical protein [Pontixanthobacter aquaemixtae]|uniref:Uncharacterized protein n=1 Tax=Pontixanthobacter aquaemixtae TaxID=1958940 RepID=A0A844ZPI0_9SPHN|nr:hypothetical protein [Pontixanthobacter aquaemixtae]MXO89648.1 hypothetical protein [Pontixanthobacter aquaemixtae]